MNQQTSIGSLPEPAQREPTPVQRNAGALTGGVVMIILGVIFLLQQGGWLLLRNWWALFILIPAAAAFGAAWSHYRAAGNQWSASVGGSVIGGVFFLIVTGILLLDLAWDMIWPAMLILAGIAVLLNAWLGDSKR